MNATLSAGYSGLVKPVSWTDTASVIKILISGRRKKSPSSVVSGKIARKPAYGSTQSNPAASFFYDAIVLPSTPGVNQTEKELRVIGYRIGNKIYWIATNRYDLSAEELTTIYKLRWNIEIFFGWWKHHLKVYHLIARTKRGLLTQILGGLITYLLLAIYCHEQYQGKVSIKRVRELRIKIQNETRNLKNNQSTPTCHQVGP